jgi:hypothetical protein
MKDVSLSLFLKHELVLAKAKLRLILAQKRINPKKFAQCGKDVKITIG